MFDPHILLFSTWSKENKNTRWNSEGVYRSTGLLGIVAPKRVLVLEWMRTTLLRFRGFSFRFVQIKFSSVYHGQLANWSHACSVIVRISISEANHVSACLREWNFYTPQMLTSLWNLQLQCFIPLVHLASLRIHSPAVHATSSCERFWSFQRGVSSSLKGQQTGGPVGSQIPQRKPWNWQKIPFDRDPTGGGAERGGGGWNFWAAFDLWYSFPMYPFQRLKLSQKFKMHFQPFKRHP